MAADSTFLTGIVEGFYGRSWPWSARKDYARFLSDLGLNTYLYCPKGDTYLRRRWRDAWPGKEFSALKETGAALSGEGILWGVGLSPFELYLDYGAREREELYSKIQLIAELDAPLLAILFDDMPGGLDALAARQAEIVSDIQGWMPNKRLLVCPTYYSFDPVLEKHFGDRPAHYWPELGATLPAEVDIFWTGNQVCSPSITSRDLLDITDLLSRPVILWDNYPVNDGAVRSNHLYLQQLHGRDGDIRPLLSGHLCNPMNQAYTSLPALAGLGRLYGEDSGTEGQLRSMLGEELMRCLARDAREFETLGLSGMGADRCSQLAEEYALLPGPAAAEIAGWLRGEYRFDPDCLTD
jgi:hyaluronoglucosaminidase